LLYFLNVTKCVCFIFLVAILLFNQIKKMQQSQGPQSRGHELDIKKLFFVFDG